MPVPITALQGDPARFRLAELGWEAQELRSGIQYGYAQAADCTDHEPRSLPGTIVWGKSVGALRDTKKTQGWQAGRASNYETVINPAGTLAVAVASGTHGTGFVEGTPRTKTPKGPATFEVVQANAQLQLFPAASAAAMPSSSIKRETWILLHYFDRFAEEIRIELSMPLEMKGKQITAWRERIMLDAWPFEIEADLDFSDPDGPIDPDIDIPISRKSH